jgi:anhydro-N-acetylmuramic acid kinase
MNAFFIFIQNNFMLPKGTWHSIGLMSGTSLDGVDIAYVHFSKNNTLKYKLLATETIPYNSEWYSKLKNAFQASGNTLTELNIAYGFYLGSLVKSFITRNNLSKVDFISSHGHTIFHNPAEKYTLQIGHGAAITQTTGITCISDFRTQDVIMGGEGAPLVPIGDQLLFAEYDYCLNLGGFSNVSFDKNRKRTAFDICPVNILLNHYVQKLGKQYDSNGLIAQRGKLNQKLLDRLNNLDIYQQKKSMGYESLEKYYFPVIDKTTLEIPDILHTLVAHITSQIAKVLKPNTTTLITGGGAYNTFLIKQLQSKTKSQIILPENTIIDYKEALIFSLLGLLRLHNQPNILSSVTGATHNHSSGVIFQP